MCRRSTRILRALDWLNRLDFQDMNQTKELPVAFDEAMRGMPMRTRNGRVLVGFPAVRRALLQTPLGFLPSLVFYLPGVNAIARIVYNRTAERRARDLTCAVSPRTRD